MITIDKKKYISRLLLLQGLRKIHDAAEVGMQFLLLSDVFAF